MNKHLKLTFTLLFALLFCLMVSGCQVLDVFQATPMPLETATPKLSLNQVTDIPTLPAVTPTPTPSIGSSVRYEEPADIFAEVTAEMLPEKSYDQVVIFGTVTGFTTQTDAWGNTIYTDDFEISHHSGTVFTVTCDDFCFVVDARKNLLPTSALTRGMEVIIFGASDNTVTDINADMIAVHTVAAQPEIRYADMSGLSNDLIYTEYELESFPQLNPISINAAAATSVPVIQPTEDSSAQNGNGYDPYDPYGYNQQTNNTGYDYYYGYGYNSYGRPTSTPNRPTTATPTPVETSAPQPTPTEALNDLLADRLNHSLESRSTYSFGTYGEQYSVYLEYDQDQNRDPEHPTRAVMNVDSNSYTFTEYWIPYVQNPMFVNWGIVCYAGDWYLPMRLTVDIDPDPTVTNLVYTDRTIRSQANYDKSQGYLRSFGYSIINDKLFYFYQKENGYGISINRQDFDLGFDDVPFGYVGNYTEIDPFYADDLITFFGHRNGKWYYVELKVNEAAYPYGYY